MTDEFVDFYEILELPVEAERSEIRKRISELYIEAQKNLDHRDFNKRVRNQQLFEMTLPQARYILLDDGRRDDYDRLVRASRASNAGASASSDAATTTTVRATEMEQSGSSGAAPRIDALPDAALDPAAVAREREELWNKWKSGLQGAMEREVAKENKTSGAAATPLADRIEAAQAGAPQPQTGSGETANPDASASEAASVRTRPKRERPKVKFDFDGASANASADAPAQAASAPAPGVAEVVGQAANALSPQQFEERRINHRREVIRAELENTGVKASFIGAALVLVPGRYRYDDVYEHPLSGQAGFGFADQKSGGHLAVVVDNLDRIRLLRRLLFVEIAAPQTGDGIANHEL